MSEKMVQFVTAACNGDTDAMAKLYAKTLKSSYFLAATLSDDETEAVDITKKAYAKAFCNISKLKKPEAFEIWMKQNVSAVYKDTHNFIFDESDESEAETSSEFLSESILEDAAKCEDIYSAVKSLEQELKAAVVLHYNNGMPVNALAKFLGVSEKAANALLVKAESKILEKAELEASEDENPGALPVLTRIFQNASLNGVIDGNSVREMFIFAIEAYEAAESAKKEESASAPVVPVVEETQPEETSDEKETESVVEMKADETADEPIVTDNVISFKDRINEILDGEKIKPAGEPEDEKEELDIPEFTPSSSASDNVEETVKIYGGVSLEENTSHPPLAPIVETPAETAKGKFDIKKLNKKTIAIAAAVLVVLIVIIAAFAGGNDKPDVDDKTTDSSSQSTQAVSSDSAYKWVPGGFEECSEITYLNENYCMFKSVTTGKYGLLDYQGNVVLQPNYDGFRRCGSGKDYTGNNNYHIVVVIENEEYGITTVNGEITVETSVHQKHQMDEYVGLGDKAYDERDRYFEGYAAARKDGKWGYVNQEKDKKVIGYEYDAVNDLNDTGEALFSDYCRPVSGGLVPVKKDGVMGIIDLDEKTVVDFSYTNIMPGNNGVYIACQNGTWGVILVGNAMTSFAGVNITVTVEPEPPTESEVQVDSGSTRKKYKVISEDGINVRTDAGADYDKIGSLQYGDIVESYATKLAENGNYWVRIKYNGEYGWVAMTMLERVRN